MKKGVFGWVCFSKQLIISGVNLLFDKLRVLSPLVKDNVQEVCFLEHPPFFCIGQPPKIVFQKKKIFFFFLIALLCDHLLS